MRFSPDFLSEIKDRLPVSEVVGARVKLKRSGREWKGLTPFNEERTPSFYANDSKQFYHCFSSGKHGDIFNFLMETEGLTFPESVERLAARAGVDLPAPANPAAARKRVALHDVMEAAAAWYEARLATIGGSKARAYLQGRGIGEAERRAFRIGYAPEERFALRDHLAEMGVDLGTMTELGLVVAGPGIPVAYDRFRDRVTFPIRDPQGRVVAFGGRAMSPDAPAKYLNSPETPLFHKGRMLYNVHAARPAAHASGVVVAVEGYTDVVAMARAGHADVVAPLGTALTADQLAILWGLSDEPVLCFDGDDAGRRAAFRVVDLALAGMRAGKGLRFALLPQGRDPDSLIAAEGVGAMRDALATSLPLIDMLWAREAADVVLSTPERRAGLDVRLRKAVKGIEDPILRKHFAQELDDRLHSSIAAFRAAAIERARPAAPSPGPASAPARPAPVEPAIAPMPKRAAPTRPPRPPAVAKAPDDTPVPARAPRPARRPVPTVARGDADEVPGDIPRPTPRRSPSPRVPAGKAPPARAGETVPERLAPAPPRPPTAPARPAVMAPRQMPQTPIQRLRQAEGTFADDPSEENLARLVALQAATGPGADGPDDEETPAPPGPRGM